MSAPCVHGHSYRTRVLLVDSWSWCEETQRCLGPAVNVNSLWAPYVISSAVAKEGVRFLKPIYAFTVSSKFSLCLKWHNNPQNVFLIPVRHFIVIVEHYCNLSERVKSHILGGTVTCNWMRVTSANVSSEFIELWNSVTFNEILLIYETWKTR